MNRCLTKARLAAMRRCLLGGLALATLVPASAATRQTPQTTAADQAPAAVVADPAQPAARCTGEAARPAQMALQMGRSTMLRLPEPVQHRAVGNPAVVQAMLVSPDTLYIAGVDVGTTNMIVQGRSGACSVVDITVAMDPAALQATLASVMPDEKDIRVIGAADSLVLSGTVSDAAAVARATELANAYVRRPLHPLPAGSKEGPNATQQNQQQAGSGVRVVNLLAVSAPQQVQLEVKIAEVSKTLLDRLEAGATFKFGGSSWAATLLSNFISGSTGGALGASHNNGKQALTLGADKQDGVVRVLAEPNVMAISGQEGSFLAGGKFYIPVPQDNGRISMEEKEFGVGLRFTPTVLSGGRINLRVAPEVSELSHEGVSVTGANNQTALLPALTTRKASTTVQLYDGQSFAIGGLIKNNLTTAVKGLPVLGEVPILGALFRSADYQQDRTELVFVITARLVKPMASTNYVLPTDKVGVPSRGAVLLGGRLEGPAPDTTTAAVSAPPASTPVAASAGGFELK
jgi:pilus assembly protein CpaC